MRADERAAWHALSGGRVARFADWTVCSTTLGAAGIILFLEWRYPELTVVLVPLLTLAVPFAYFQWSTGLRARQVWLPAALIWWAFLGWAAVVSGLFDAWWY